MLDVAAVPIIANFVLYLIGEAFFIFFLSGVLSVSSQTRWSHQWLAVCESVGRARAAKWGADQDRVGFLL